MPDEVARIGALSNGSNGQRSLESASLHFEAILAASEPPAEILSVAKDLLLEAERESAREILSCRRKINPKRTGST